MKKSPFSNGSLASASAFISPENELKNIRNSLVGRNNVILYAPKRCGKTSLLKELFNEIQKNGKDTRPVYISLYSIKNQQEFLEVFAREVIKASESRWDEWTTATKGLFKYLIPKMGGNQKKEDFYIHFNQENLQDHPEEILNLPEKIALTKNIRFIIFLDDFHKLASLAEFQQLETLLGEHCPNQNHVTYCLSGSRQYHLKELFTVSEKPLYDFGEIVFLKRITSKKWIDFILQKFEDTGKNISHQEAEHIAVLMKNHPWYVQQLAHHTWMHTARKAGPKEILWALHDLIYLHTPLFRLETETLSKTQFNLLIALLNGEKQLTSTSVMQRYELGTPRNVSKNKKILLEKEIIISENGGFEFTDPCLELWLRKEFLQQGMDNLKEIYSIRNSYYQAQTFMTNIKSRVHL